MTLPPEKIGYKGQKYRVVVDELGQNGLILKKTIGWSETTRNDVSGLNTRPGWSNARYEEVESPLMEELSYNGLRDTEDK